MKGKIPSRGNDLFSRPTFFGVEDFFLGNPKADGRFRLLLQSVIVHRGDATSEGTLVKIAAHPWLEIVEHLERDPAFLAHFAQNPRKFEEFIAATYSRAGFGVTLTPRSSDGGRDVIVVKPGFGSVRFLEQTKAYSPGHLVTHDDVRAMLGVLNLDRNTSKGLITTTSDFQPGILRPNGEFAAVMPHRLELKNGRQLMEWLKQIRSETED